MNPKEDPQFRDEGEDTSKQKKLRQEAEGVVNELKKFISDLKDPAPEDESPSVPEDSSPDSNPFNPPREETPPPSKEEMSFSVPPMEDPAPGDSEDNGGFQRMGDAGLPPKGEDKRAQSTEEEDPSDNVPSFPAREMEVAPKSQPDDKDFWEGNVLGWPEEDKEGGPKKSEARGENFSPPPMPAREEHPNEKPSVEEEKEELLAEPSKTENFPEPERPIFDPFAPDAPEADNGRPHTEKQPSPSETPKDKAPNEPERPMFDPFAPDPSDPPSVPSSPEDPKRGAQESTPGHDVEERIKPIDYGQMNKESDTSEEEEQKPVFSEERGPREIDLGGFDDKVFQKPSSEKKEEIPGKGFDLEGGLSQEGDNIFGTEDFSPPSELAPEPVEEASSLPEVVVGGNLIPGESSGPDLEELKKQFPKGPSEEEAPFAPTMPSPYEKGEAPPQDPLPTKDEEVFEEKLDIERNSSFVSEEEGKSFEPPAQESLVASEEKKEPEMEIEGNEFGATKVHPDDVYYVALVFPQGMEEKADTFVSKLRELATKREKPLDIQDVFKNPYPEGTVDIRGWESSAEMTGSNFMFVLAPKAQLASLKKEIHAGTNGDWKGRIVCLEHLGMRTLYADILIQLGRMKR